MKGVIYPCYFRILRVYDYTIDYKMFDKEYHKTYFYIISDLELDERWLDQRKLDQDLDAEE